MQTAIGQNLQSRSARLIGLGIVVVVVLCDFWVMRLRLAPLNHGALAILAFAALVRLTEGDLRSLGLLMWPKQGGLRWIRLTLLLGVLILALYLVGINLWIVSGYELPIDVRPPVAIGRRFLGMCFLAPVLEETLYRLVICVPLVPLIGCWPTIAVSGLAFAAIHIAAGVASPENLVGGFLLAWAFLKSESLLVPILLHSAGNAVALGTQIVGWYLL